MPRLSLTYLLPVLLFVGTIVLFIHGWTRPAPEAGAPAASVAVEPGAPPGGTGSGAAPAAQSGQGG